ncbi:hypothetical protein J2Z60_001823 [Lactobacillus colini]|uniref:Uncharacterized protein n=1 Tax=Lactobacillus colini TaxID=1819254 RepID=A0ABS4MG18_9LACO|nr:hypothetical protein [Lactobacillus colini]MBP2058635.1 hypothetical protein [Lactobacillus colini]
MDWNVINAGAAWTGAILSIGELILHLKEVKNNKPIFKFKTQEDYPCLNIPEEVCSNRFGGPHLSLNIVISNIGNKDGTIEKVTYWLPKEHRWMPTLPDRFHLNYAYIKYADNLNIPAQTVRFKEFENYIFPQQVISNGTLNIHLCLPPNAVLENQQARIKFTFPRGEHIQDFQLLSPENFLQNEEYKLIEWRPPLFLKSKKEHH